VPARALFACVARRDRLGAAAMRHGRHKARLAEYRRFVYDSAGQERENLAPASAEGATAPETLRLKDRT